mmetsp:Transcript_5/g.8  ORF Transcript_5/g.8 Transcript_5/m.8 type:complete len:88 (-) Transcript_5:1242-1505(-)
MRTLPIANISNIIPADAGANVPDRVANELKPAQRSIVGEAVGSGDIVGDVVGSGVVGLDVGAAVGVFVGLGVGGTVGPVASSSIQAS